MNSRPLRPEPMSTVRGNMQTSSWSGLATVPEFLWELSIGIWLIVKGFNPSPIPRRMPAPFRRRPIPAAVVTAGASKRRLQLWTTLVPAGVRPAG